MILNGRLIGFALLTSIALKHSRFIKHPVAMVYSVQCIAYSKKKATRNIYDLESGKYAYWKKCSIFICRRFKKTYEF